MIKILFVCTANIDRSPTAERIYSNYPEFEVKSAGISWFARTPVTEELIEWADVILCMQDFHKQFIEEEFPNAIANKTIDYLDVSDIYHFMHPTLVEIIKEKTDAWLVKANIQINKTNK